MFSAYNRPEPEKSSIARSRKRTLLFSAPFIGFVLIFATAVAFSQTPGATTALANRQRCELAEPFRRGKSDGLRFRPADYGAMSADWRMLC
jgi:hypothetical protein